MQRPNAPIFFLQLYELCFSYLKIHFYSSVSLGSANITVIAANNSECKISILSSLVVENIFSATLAIKICNGRLFSFSFFLFCISFSFICYEFVSILINISIRTTKHRKTDVSVQLIFICALKIKLSGAIFLRAINLYFIFYRSLEVSIFINLLSAIFGTSFDKSNTGCIG